MFKNSAVTLMSSRPNYGIDTLFIRLFDKYLTELTISVMKLFGNLARKDDTLHRIEFHIVYPKCLVALFDESTCLVLIRV